MPRCGGPRPQLVRRPHTVLLEKVAFDDDGHGEVDDQRVAVHWWDGLCYEVFADEGFRLLDLTRQMCEVKGNDVVDPTKICMYTSTGGSVLDNPVAGMSCPPPHSHHLPGEPSDTNCPINCAREEWWKLGDASTTLQTSCIRVVPSRARKGEQEDVWPGLREKPFAAPFGVKSTIRILRNKDSVVVTWGKPISITRVPIDHYVVQYFDEMKKDGFKDIAIVAASASETKIDIKRSGVKHGRSYMFRVAAVDKNGKRGFYQVTEHALMTPDPKAKVPGRAPAQRRMREEKESEVEESEAEEPIRLSGSARKRVAVERVVGAQSARGELRELPACSSGRAGDGECLGTANVLLICNPNSDVDKLAVGHLTFCRVCLFKWRRENSEDSCSVCRAKINQLVILSTETLNQLSEPCRNRPAGCPRNRQVIFDLDESLMCRHAELCAPCETNRRSRVCETCNFRSIVQRVHVVV